MPPAKKIKHPTNKLDGRKGDKPDNTISEIKMLPIGSSSTNNWCGQYIIMDDGFHLICERREHKPKLDGFDDDKSPHVATFNGHRYEWGQDYEDSLRQLGSPYNDILPRVETNGAYNFSHLSGRDIGKFIEYTKGAKTIAGVIGSLSFYTDTAAQRKNQKKRRAHPDKKIPEDNGQRVHVVVSRGDAVEGFVAKLNEEFRLYYGRQSNGY